MKAVVATTFNQEKALVGAFSVITNLRVELFQALLDIRSRQESSAGNIVLVHSVAEHTYIHMGKYTDTLRRVLLLARNRREACQSLTHYIHHIIPDLYWNI